MSHSTTTTSTYNLVKYSRSYPSNASSQRDQSPNGASEWQHFTNPVIRLVLDVTKRSSNELESARLRILWDMNAGNDDLNQPEVVFEDLELLSFSSLASITPQKQHSQGLPLKAVYRDTVVGIRYLHPRENIDNPVYRRFQVSFQSPSTVVELINSIRTVCPCRANPMPPAPPTNTNANNLMLPPDQPAHPRLPRTINSANSLLPDRNHPFPYTPSPPVTTSMSMRPPLTEARQVSAIPSFSSPSFTQPSSQNSQYTHARTASPLQLDTSGSQMDWPSAPVQSQSRTGTSILTQARSSNLDLTRGQLRAPAPIDLPTQAHLLLPDSSPPTSSNQSSTKAQSVQEQNNSNPTSGLVNDKTDSDPIFSALREATSIYNLPPDTLERIVGDVVREEGFTALVHTVFVHGKIVNTHLEGFYLARDAWKFMENQDAYRAIINP